MESQDGTPSQNLVNTAACWREWPRTQNTQTQLEALRTLTDIGKEA